jgi:5-amino-6-(5-phospho-D-ribitylamino)uracil phosphatase
MKELYISDLDGTLLDEHSKLSKRTELLLTTMLNLGLNFTIASLRSFEPIKAIFKNIPLQLPVIELNGAFITDFKTGRKLVTHAINPDIHMPIYQTILANELTPAIISHDGENNFLNFGNKINQGLAWYWENRKAANDKRLRKINHIEKIKNDAWICITTIAKRHQCMVCKEKLENEYTDRINVNILDSLDTPGLVWMSITAKTASKYTAIQTLKRQFNFNDHKIICFGDQPIDIPMFKAADFSVAVSNATSEVKLRSNLVIGNHQASSVAEWIFQQFKY